MTKREYGVSKKGVGSLLAILFVGGTGRTIICQLLGKRRLLVSIRVRAGCGGAQPGKTDRLAGCWLKVMGVFQNSTHVRWTADDEWNDIIEIGISKTGGVKRTKKQGEKIGLLKGEAGETVVEYAKCWV